jgi:ATP-dependent Zn protease
MRTILLAANESAIMNDLIFIFELEHIQQVLPSIIINCPKKRALIYEAFDYTHKKFKELDYGVNLSKSKSELATTDDVLQRLQGLRDNGVNIFSDAGISIYKGKLPRHYKSDIVLNNTSKLNTTATLPITKTELNKITSLKNGFDYLEEIAELKETLNATVLSQENAVNAICNALIKDQFQPNSTRPKGIFFFIGPPATGKTFLAQNLEHSLRDFTASMTFDMTQLTHHESGGSLYGTAQFWGNAQPGVLSSFVRENPKSILIFDEFEKANKTVQSNLLSILSDGYLDDACGWFEEDGAPWNKDRLDDYIDKTVVKRVDFSQTIVIFTSNLGKDIYENQALLHKFKDDPDILSEMVFESISKSTKSTREGEQPAITPEFISRLRQGSLALFQKLSYADLLNISEEAFEQETKSFSKSYDIKFTYPKELITLLLLSFAPNLDVRAIKAGISKDIINTVTQYYLAFKQPIANVTVMLDASIKKDLHKLLEDDDLLRTLKRKNTTIQFDLKKSYSNETLTLMVDNLHTAQHVKPQDLGESGLCIEVPRTRFTDIAGHSLVKEKLQETVALFKNYEKVQEHGIKMSKGILLYGSPGTGKTMLAKALAHEADLPFISTTGEKLLHPDEIKNVFEIAKEYAPSILFIDEIDAFTSRESSSDAMGIAVNRLLTNIDGFNTNSDTPVYIVATTNLKNKIDPALLRSGRLDLHIEVGLLDYEAREYFIDKMLKNKLFDQDIDKQQLIKYSAGLNGSDLEKIQRELILNTFKHEITSISTEDILEQINTIKYGRRIDKKNIDTVLEATAYHEAGHAILAKILTPLNKIEQVTIMPRSNALGFVSFAMENDQYNANDITYLKNEIYVLLAGRVAQEMKFNSLGIDAGASSDLNKANQLIYKAITRYGMDDVLKNINTSMFDTNTSLYQNNTIFKRQEFWISEATEKTKQLVKEYWTSIEALAKTLLEKEFIDGSFLDKYVEKSTSAQAIYQSACDDDIRDACQ